MVVVSVCLGIDSNGASKGFRARVMSTSSSQKTPAKSRTIEKHFCLLGLALCQYYAGQQLKTDCTAQSIETVNQDSICFYRQLVCYWFGRKRLAWLSPHAWVSRLCLVLSCRTLTFCLFLSCCKSVWLIAAQKGFPSGLMLRALISSGIIGPQTASFITLPTDAATFIGSICFTGTYLL